MKEPETPFIWHDDDGKDVTPFPKAELSVVWSNDLAAYEYRFVDDQGHYSYGDAQWAIRMAKHYGLEVPKVTQDRAKPLIGKRPLGPVKKNLRPGRKA